MATKTRPRGFITDWRPRAATQALLDQVQAVLAEYAEQLPLTLRQLSRVGYRVHREESRKRPGKLPRLLQRQQVVRPGHDPTFGTRQVLK